MHALVVAQLFIGGLLYLNSASLVHSQAEERDTGPTAERVESRTGSAARRQGRCAAGAYWQPRRRQQRWAWWQVACRRHRQTRESGDRYVKQANSGPKAKRAQIQVR